MSNQMMNGSHSNGVMNDEEIKAQKAAARRHLEIASNGLPTNGVSNGHSNGVSNGHSNGVSNGVSNGHTATDDMFSEERKQEDVKFLERMFEVITKDVVEKYRDEDAKVVDFRHPAELRTTLDLDIREGGVDDDQIIRYCKDTIKYSVRTGHPHFFNQLFAGFNRYGCGGALLTEAMNPSAYTYEVSPVFTLMEDVVLKHMRAIVGWTEGDGIFCPGGSVSNMYAMNLGRYYKFPEIKAEGMGAVPKLILFTSEQCHYSIKKGAGFLGLGCNNVWSVKCNSKGQMDLEHLEELINKAKDEGYYPFFVNATAGTTVVGAYDDIDGIADIAERYGLWMHVDLCWGGGALLSKKYRHLTKGVHRADTVAWNPHKMMGAPLQCCAFLTKHGNKLLDNCHSANAQYLFQQDKFYDVSYDTGDKSVQCGRKVDVFKLWLMWKAKGDLGFEQGIDNIFAQADYLRHLAATTPGFRLVFDSPQCTNVCFWYIPPCLRGQEENKDWYARLGKVAPIIKMKMVTQGTMLVGYQPLGDIVNFFRFVIINLDITKETIEFAFNEIRRLGEDIQV